MWASEVEGVAVSHGDVLEVRPGQDEQARQIRDNMPVLGDRPPGVDLPTLLNALEVRVATEELIQSGTATIANGDTTIAVAVGVALNGKLAVVSFAEAPTAATLIFAAPVAGGNLTITIDQDNTTTLDVHFVLDGR